MVDLKLSSKRVQIGKANTVMIAVVAASSFITVFSLVSAKYLLGLRTYQSKVIKAKQDTLNLLKEDVNNVNSLKLKYLAFTSEPENIIAGNGSPQATGDRDGDNSRIILDALPSRYDFPALTSSLEKVFINGGFQVKSISGSDDEVAQSTNKDAKPVEIPFQLSISGQYTDIQRAIDTLDKSIRPIKVKTLDITGDNKSLTLTVSAVTYYQPGKTFTVHTKEIK